MQFAEQELWAWIVLAGVLSLAAWKDLRTGRVPNWLTIPPLLAGLAVHGILGGWDGNESHPLGLSGALVGFAAGFIPMAIAFAFGGIGGADAKLMALVGALTGWRFAIAVLVYAFIAAAVMAIVIIIRKKIARDTFKRIWNFLWLLALMTKPADPSRPESPKVAFAVAVLIGFIAAVVEVLGYGGFLLKI